MQFLFLSIFFSLVLSCANTLADPLANYYLEWRASESFYAGRHDLAEAQWDSLQQRVDTLTDHAAELGLTIQMYQNQPAAEAALFRQLSPRFQRRFCSKEWAELKPFCTNRPPLPPPTQPEYQSALDRLLLDSRAVDKRPSSSRHWRYQRDGTKIWNGPTAASMAVQYDELVNQFGPPTYRKVGREGMEAVLPILEQLDASDSLQLNRLAVLETAARHRYINAVQYAELYDRCQVQLNRMQRYGTQYKPTIKEGIIEYYPIIEAERVDHRRRDLGVMPLAMHRRRIEARANNK